MGKATRAGGNSPSRPDSPADSGESATRLADKLMTRRGLREAMAANLASIDPDCDTRDQLAAKAETRRHLEWFAKEQELEQQIEQIENLETRLAKDDELASARRGSALRADMAPAPSDPRGRETN